MKKSSSGFTLVELSIAIIIIGLLIGGILKGSALITSARIKTTIKDIQSYQVAVNTFRDVYGALPGDISNATAFIPGCAGHSYCEAAGGNGDGFVGTADVSNWSHDNQSDLDSEPTQMWLHLALADLIGGVAGRASQNWGEAYPAARLRGGFQAFHGSETGVNQATGHFLILRKEPTGDPHPDTSDTGALSPYILSIIDRTIDDGVPNLGHVISDDNFGRCWNPSSRIYTTASNDFACISAYKIQ